MRKFTSDYIYGVIDSYITTCEIEPKIEYSFLVQVYNDYAAITFTFGDNEEWWFKLVKGEPLIKLNKSVKESLEIIRKYEKVE